MHSKTSISFDIEPLFPVYMLKGRMPDNALQFLIHLTDYILKEKSEDFDYSNYLAGQIIHGKQLSIPVDGKGIDDPALISGLNDFTTMIKEICSHYITQTSSVAPSSQTMWKEHDIKVNDMWLVSQYAGDYNPVHTHATTLSGIVYLKVPPQINNENQPSGWVNFVHGNSWGPMQLNFSGTMPMLPVVGDFLLFPSWLNHEVYPYEGEGERRCLPFNVNAFPKGGGKF